MSNTLIIALIGWIGGIITTWIGVLLHSFMMDRKLKKRLCQALYEELEYNLTRLKKSIMVRGKEYSIPHTFFISNYTEARNYGLVKQLPKEICNSIENFYSVLQLLNIYRFGTLTGITDGSIIFSEPMSGEVDEAAKSIDEVLPKLKEFCSNLRVYPNNDIAYVVRKIKKAG